jgi:acyl carrier protein
MSVDSIKEEIRNYIVSSLLKNRPISIEFDSHLISEGIIDSISTLQIVHHLEKKYNIEFQPHEVDRENLDTINLIAEFVMSKRQSA